MSDGLKVRLAKTLDVQVVLSSSLASRDHVSGWELKLSSGGASVREEKIAGPPLLQGQLGDPASLVTVSGDPR